jgi:hypothetical protein
MERGVHDTVTDVALSVSTLTPSTAACAMSVCGGDTVKSISELQSCSREKDLSRDQHSVMLGVYDSEMDSSGWLAISTPPELLYFSSVDKSSCR